MFERFTDRARRVLVLAQEEARLLGHGFIGTEHILLGLIAEGDGIAARALQALDISLEATRERVEKAIGVSGAATAGSPPFTPRAKKVLELALREALQLGHNYIGTEHLLLGVVREGEGVAAQVLVAEGADLVHVREQVLELLGAITEADEAAPHPAAGIEVRKGRARRAGPAPASRPVVSGDPPYCPQCGHSLVDNVGVATLAALQGPDADITRPVVVVYCLACSLALGTHGAGVDDTETTGGADHSSN